MAFLNALGINLPFIGVFTSIWLGTFSCQAGYTHIVRELDGHWWGHPFLSGFERGALLCQGSGGGRQHHSHAHSPSGRANRWNELSVSVSVCAGVRVDGCARVCVCV